MKNLIFFVIVFSLMFSSCSDDDAKEARDGYPADLAGTIYYKWATEGILKVDLPSATGSSVISDDTKLNSFDISRDGQYRLTAVNASTLGNDIVRFTLSKNNATGSIVNEFDYESPARNRFCKGQLSPDNSLILVESNDDEDGITILKINGELVARLEGLEGIPFSMHDMKMWLPNNELLITHGNYIVRVPAPYTNGSLVKQMEYEDWGHLTVNQAGTTLAMRIANHIHTMDIDGTNLKQVTTSNFREGRPVFSPDGKYLMIGSHYRQSSIMGYSWDMKIIPNDGQQYNVDPNEPNSAGVIPVIWKGEEKIVTGSGDVIWK